MGAEGYPVTTDSPRPRVVVVVGAGRSGTSALTCGIQALGVELGEQLKASSRKNAKGFFEDQDFIAINYRLRDALGFKRSGAGVSVVPLERFQQDDLEPVFRDAVRLVRDRFAGYPLWGFKAGGVLSFLPFWERVFSAAGQAPSYVLALRNPLSVAQSRSQVSLRRGIQENSDLEFLARVVPYFRRAAQSPFAVVDYDRLMEDAKGELLRVAGALDLPVDAGVEANLDEYGVGFLSPGLRHHCYGEDDLYSHPRLNPLARDTYLALYRLASGKEEPTSEAFWREWDWIERTHAAMAPALRHIDSLEAELRRSRKGVEGIFVLAMEWARRWRNQRPKA